MIFPLDLHIHLSGCPVTSYFHMSRAFLDYSLHLINEAFHSVSIGNGDNNRFGNQPDLGSNFS